MRAAGGESDRKVVLVVRETRLEELTRRFNTRQQARFYIEHLGADYGDYLAEHQRYTEAVSEVDTALRGRVRVQKLDRRYLPNFVFGGDDLVIVLGQDGLVANSLKYLDGQPVIGVNPDPARWDGVLLPFQPSDLSRVVPEVIAGRRNRDNVTMAEAKLNTGSSLLAVNDLFIGPKSHVSARYVLTLGEQSERQSSSGIIVSTGLGSTGWLRSIYAGMAAAVTSLYDRDALLPDGSFQRNAQELHFTVREPFPSRTTRASLVLGRFGAETPLEILSEMPENGVIFSDGIESDFLEFNSGTRATIGIARRQGVLVT
ncbi:NAD(+)/NADH kinase [Peteryoungia ipomoeae]|uniref:Sugar kinase n=1 Tax=Peteryoungia ipomoeae TaxID=1210932 RepID=A0A4S8PBG1_9HYPH|nr:NAD(+)/NADH kinase [Peteryoungia ipomoeae]THV25409.1 sugar kinase [Peteryoungia ipomoeae]